MKYRNFILSFVALTFVTSVAQADMPPNVKCAISAQEKARGTGAKYRKIYTRNFELCMLNAMPREQQTTYLIEKLGPYVAISPGLREQTSKKQTAKEAKFTGTWVRLSPNIWVLQGN